MLYFCSRTGLRYFNNKSFLNYGSHIVWSLPHEVVSCEQQPHNRVDRYAMAGKRMGRWLGAYQGTCHLFACSFWEEGETFTVQWLWNRTVFMQTNLRAWVSVGFRILPFSLYFVIFLWFKWPTKHSDHEKFKFMVHISNVYSAHRIFEISQLYY